MKLKAFRKFKDSIEATKTYNKLLEGKLPKILKNFLTTNIISKEIQDKLYCKFKYPILKAQRRNWGD